MIELLLRIAVQALLFVLDRAPEDVQADVTAMAEALIEARNG